MQPTDAQWDAMQHRDPEANGKFWCAVKTTKIYCRPICPARPHRKNIEIFATREEAQQAGFRACKRCKPDQN
jgi:methylphosphotriester-DNA--protein-cysteine methyltransferase